MVQRKFDAIHEFVGSGSLVVEDSISTKKSIIFPIIMNDDALGDPMNFKAHPEHASWAEVAQPNCFPDSEIRGMRISCQFIVPKATAGISSAVIVRYGFISCAFPEDLDALDEKSGLTLKEVLELQKETTDRQVYPLWSGVKISNGSTLAANIPGLTTNQVMEGVNFDVEVLRDQRRYGRIKGLIKKCMPIGMRTLFLRGNSSAGYIKRLTFNFTPSNAKFINPYTFFGLLLDMPQAFDMTLYDSTKDQLMDITATTVNVEHIQFGIHVQYNERNPEFHMGKV